MHCLLVMLAASGKAGLAKFIPRDAVSAEMHPFAHPTCSPQFMSSRQNFDFNFSLPQNTHACPVEFLQALSITKPGLRRATLTFGGFRISRSYARFDTPLILLESLTLSLDMIRSSTTLVIKL
jgi:hypothetical protein